MHRFRSGAMTLGMSKSIRIMLLDRRLWSVELNRDDMPGVARYKVGA